MLQGLPYLKGIKQEQMENILDRFDARVEMMQGDTIIKQGDMVGVWSWGILEGGGCQASW